MATPLISHKSPRRRLFDDEIMAQIALRATDMAVRPKRRRFSFRARIALMFLFIIVLVARTSTHYLLMNRDSQPTKLVELKVESRQPVRRDVDTTTTKSYCIPESNVVANPMFVDFVHWDKAPLYYGYNNAYWLTDGSPAGAYMYYIPESKYPDGDYPSLIQKITLTPGLEYNISLSAQFRPRKLDSKQYYVALLVAEDENFRSIIYTLTSHMTQITNGTFFGTFGATASTAHVKLMAASLDYDSYFHKLTIYPSEDTTCGHQDPLSPLDLIGING
ncbi:hypothetical protein V1504DRAFT_436524 [Lipomyces starkeyi]